MYPRGRPQRLQRERACTGNRGGRRLAITLDFFANCLSSPHRLNGIPSAASRLRPSASVLAVVTIVISSPLSLSILS